MKRSRKLISVLLTLSLLAALLVPLATPAAASTTTYSTLSTPTIAKSNTLPVDLGTIKVDVDFVGNGTPSKVAFSLPTGVTLSTVAGHAIPDPTITQTIGSLVAGTDITLPNSPGTTPTVTANVYYLDERSFRLELTPGASYSNLSITIPITATTAGVSGDITCLATALTGQIGGGSVVVAKAGDASLTLAMSSEADQTITTATTVKILAKESRKGGLDATTTGTKSLKFKLPSGFSWVGGFIVKDVSTGAVATGHNVGTLGDGIYCNVDSNDSRTLIVYRDQITNVSKTVFEIDGNVTADETTAKYGDVVVSVSGQSTADPTSITVGKYQDYGVTVSADEAKSIKAGKNDQELADVLIEENAAGSLQADRTVRLVLPDGAKWDSSGGYSPSIEVDNNGAGLGYSVITVDTNDYHKASFTINHNGMSTKATTLRIKNLHVATSASLSGDVEITVEGTAGAKGTVKVATCVAPVTASADGTVPNMVIGQGGQAAADFSIVEGASEAIDKNTTINAMKIVAPTGVTFDEVPTVEVTEGDFQVDSVTKTDNDTSITIKTKSTSTKASTLKISGVKLTVDRTVPVGPINLKLQGLNINATYGTAADAAGSVHFTDETVALVNVATVGTPAPTDQTKSVKFVIGDTKFTVNGVEQTMDVAPYVKDGRTFLPVRFVAQALGVSDSNILWDQATQKVTLIKGDKVVQLTIGSKVMLINGIAVTMDVPAEITSDRTMLPFRFIAQAFGATVGWDDATQTVTMEL